MARPYLEDAESAESEYLTRTARDKPLYVAITDVVMPVLSDEFMHGGSLHTALVSCRAEGSMKGVWRCYQVLGYCFDLGWNALQI